MRQAGSAKALLLSTGDSFISGEFDGWMTIVAVPSGNVPCETQLEFENSPSVGGGLRLKVAPKKSTQKVSDDDFEDHFEDAARQAAKKMSGGKLKLRVGFF